MKKILTTLLLSLSALFFVGCGMHEFKAGDPLLALEQTKEASKAECYRAQAKNVIDTAGLSELGKVMLLQQQSYERLVGALTGKSFDPCGGGTNLNDVLIADVTQRNETARSVTGSAAGVVKVGLGVWGATEVVDSIGKNAGSQSNVSTEGGDSTISNTRTNTETVTKSTATNAGEGTATTNPGVDDTVPAADPVAPDVDVVADPVIITED